MGEKFIPICLSEALVPSRAEPKESQQEVKTELRNPSGFFDRVFVHGAVKAEQGASGVDKMEVHGFDNYLPQHKDNLINEY